MPSQKKAPRKASKRQLADQIATLPLATYLQVAILAIALVAGLQVAGFLGGLAGGVAGLLLVAATGKELSRREPRWKALLGELARRLSSQEPEEDQKKDSRILGLYALHYLGGHPSWTVKTPAYVQVELQERAFVFKDARDHRVKLPFARLKRANLETHRTLVAKKPPSVLVTAAKSPKNAYQRIQAYLRGKMKFVLLDYQDDTGERRLIAFRPPAGNPLKARQITEAIDQALSAYRKSKAGREEAAKGGQRSIPSQSVTGVFKTSELVAAGIIEGNAVQPLSRRTVARVETNQEHRYLVVIQHAGESPEDKQRVAEAIATHFNLPPGKAWAVVERAPVVAKRNLSYQDAEHLASEFIALGAMATIELPSS